MSNSRREILVYLIVGFIVTIVTRLIVRSPIWNPETLTQWFFAVFLSLGFNSAWKTMGR